MVSHGEIKSNFISFLRETGSWYNCGGRRVAFAAMGTHFLQPLSYQTAFVPSTPFSVCGSKIHICGGCKQNKLHLVKREGNCRKTHFVSPQSKYSPESDQTTELSSETESNSTSGSAPTNQNPDAELTAKLRADLAASGVNFDDLLDGGRAVKLTRELNTITTTLESTSDEETRKRLKVKAEKLKSDLTTVSRQVMLPELKRLFLGQAVLSTVVSGVVAGDAVPGMSVPLVGRALAFWTVWLFTIPSLRARKGIASWEKSALNVAFLATPLSNLVLPAITRNTSAIWATSVAVLAGCYAYYYVRGVSREGSEGDQQGKKKEQTKIRGILRYLDWGSWR